MKSDFTQISLSYIASLMIFLSTHSVFAQRQQEMTTEQRKEQHIATITVYKIQGKTRDTSLFRKDTFNTHGDRVESTHFRNSGTSTSSTRNVFNDKNQCIKTISLTNDTVWSETGYFFDERGNRTENWQILAKGNKEVVYQVRKYDSDNNNTELYTRDGDIMLYKNSPNIQFNTSNGKRDSFYKSMTWKYKDGLEVSHTNYYHYSNGKTRVQKTKYNKDGLETHRTTYEEGKKISVSYFDYDAHGKIKNFKYFKNDQLAGHYEHQYDSAGNRNEVYDWRSGKRVLYKTYKYNAARQITEIHNIARETKELFTYDLKGRLTSYQKWEDQNLVSHFVYAYTVRA